MCHNFPSVKTTANLLHAKKLVALSCKISNSACMGVQGFQSKTVLLWCVSDCSGYDSLKRARFVLW